VDTPLLLRRKELLQGFEERMQLRLELRYKGVGRLAKITMGTRLRPAV